MQSPYPDKDLLPVDPTTTCLKVTPDPWEIEIVDDELLYIVIASPELNTEGGTIIFAVVFTTLPASADTSV